MFLQSSKISENDFIVPKSSNLFIGGLTGRSGTTWLMQVLAAVLKGKYVIIGEHGSFVLSQFRNAGYEIYQATPGNAKTRESYLKYYYHFLTNEAYYRKKIYGEGLAGFSTIVPKKAIKLAFNALKRNLVSAQKLQEFNMAIGSFYSHLLNYHSLSNGGTLNWISKEPSYGRHANDLYNMIPDCRLVVMVRDGRDTALSMAKRGWYGGDVQFCINKWQDFAQMTLASLKQVPEANYLLVNYEQFTLEFQETLQKVLQFYNIEPPKNIEKIIEAQNFRYAPKSNNFNKWKQELSEEEKIYFEKTCSNTMKELSYEI